MDTVFAQIVGTNEPIQGVITGTNPALVRNYYYQPPDKGEPESLILEFSERHKRFLFGTNAHDMAMMLGII